MRRRGPSPGNHMLAVEVWPVPWAPHARRGGVVRSLSSVWPPWVRLVPCAPYGRRGSVARLLDPVWPPWGRGPSPGPCLTTVEAWTVPCTPSGRRGGVTRPLLVVWTPWGRGPSLCPCLAAVVMWPVPWARLADVGAWLVHCFASGRSGGVARPLHPIWLPWGRGPYHGARMAACRRGQFPWPVWPLWGVALPLGTVWPRGGVACSLSLLWLL